MPSVVLENCIMMSVIFQNVECSGKVRQISCTNLTLSETNAFNMSFANKLHAFVLYYSYRKFDITIPPTCIFLGYHHFSQYDNLQLKADFLL
jgi:hypothetical protein